MPQLFQHMGRQSNDTRLFKSIKTSSPMIQNLLNVESKTGGEHWLKALDEELTRQGRTVDVREGQSPMRRLLGNPMSKLADVGRRLFGKEPLNEINLGETSGPGGIPGMSSRVYINLDIPSAAAYSQSLEGRNRYTQSLVDTLRHELGGHVMSNITPGSKWWEGGQNEATAQALSGEAEMTPRAKEVQQQYGIMPRYMSGESY